MVKNDYAGQAGGDGELEEGQTGDAESQGRQLHKDRHGRVHGGGRGRGLRGSLGAMKLGGVRETSSSSSSRAKCWQMRAKMDPCKKKAVV